MQNHSDLDKDNLNEQLLNLIQNEDITSVFQPIISLRDGSVLGYEALSRGPIGTALESPEYLFSAAEKSKKLWDI